LWGQLLTFELQELYELLVRKTGTVGDLIPLLAQKAGIDDKLLDRIRVFEVHSHKHVKELQRPYPVLNFNDFTTLCADIRSEEEVELEAGDRIAYAFSFEREVNKPHGYPFSFVVKEGELLSAAKERISKRMNVKGKGFEKIKFAVVAKTGYQKPEYLTDGKLRTYGMEWNVPTDNCAQKIYFQRR
jgi:ubiquitin carboxyl-terminal hydrolase 7